MFYYHGWEVARDEIRVHDQLKQHLQKHQGEEREENVVAFHMMGYLLQNCDKIGKNFGEAFNFYLKAGKMGHSFFFQNIPSKKMEN